jgi:hypothetical protein
MIILRKIRSYLVSILLVSGCLLLAFWLVMAERSARPGKGYSLTTRDLAGFQPIIPGWAIRVKSIDAENPTDPNIMGMELAGEPASGGPEPRFFVRLVHGYNMPMCMKIKYYAVEKIQDNRVRPVSDPKLQSAYRSLPSTTQQLSNLTTILPTEFPFQLWRLTSGAGTVSLWVTTMIRAGDFSPTPEDICSMAFPRVETPDDPNWVPRGFRLEDLRHPGEAFQRWWRSRWDGARWDWLTVLRLRQPARGSEELLSYVTRSVVPDVTPANETVVLQDLLTTHAAVLGELQQWRKKNVATGL